MTDQEKVLSEKILDSLFYQDRVDNEIKSLNFRQEITMNTYRIKVRQVYIETMFVEAESKQDAIELMWSDDCGIVDSEYKSAEAEIQSVEIV